MRTERNNGPDGGPAFPQPFAITPVGDAVENGPDTAGMTLRDYFAAKALAFVLGYADIPHTGPDEWAAAAYEIADAMLKARAAQ
jgi:hypothetical protein